MNPQPVQQNDAPRVSPVRMLSVVKSCHIVCAMWILTLDFLSFGFCPFLIRPLSQLVKHNNKFVPFSIFSPNFTMLQTYVAANERSDSLDDYSAGPIISTWWNTMKGRPHHTLLKKTIRKSSYHMNGICSVKNITSAQRIFKLENGISWNHLKHLMSASIQLPCALIQCISYHEQWTT